jgi:hypothetical protein
MDVGLGSNVCITPLGNHICFFKWWKRHGIQAPCSLGTLFAYVLYQIFHP